MIAIMAIALGLGAWASTDTDRPGPPSVAAGSQGATSVASDQVAKPIRITRVSYDPAGPDSGSNADVNREWVTITSFGQQTRRMKGWTLQDTSGHTFQFPGIRLHPNTTVTVQTGDGRATRHDLYWGMANPDWNNTGDQATLRNRDGRLIDRCRWGDGDGLRNC